MSTHTLIQGSPDPSDSKSAGSSAKKIWLIIGLVVLGLAIVYLAIGFFSGRVVGPGTSVAGVDIGGKSAADAKKVLNDELDDLAARDIEFAAGESKSTVAPSKAGVSFDVDATVDRVTGFTLDPRIIWDRLFGDNEVAPVIVTDEKAFATASKDVSTALAVEPVNAELSYSKTTPEVKQGVTGQKVDMEQLRSAIDSKWLRTDGPVTVNATALEPDITNDEADEVLTNFAEKAVSSDLKVNAKPGKDADSSVESGELTVSPKVIAKTLAFVPKDSKLVPEFDAKELREAVLEDNEKIGEPATDATFTIKDGKPQVVESKTGIGVDEKELASAVTDAIDGDEGKAEVTLTTVDPDFTTEDAKKVDLSDEVSKFSTSYSSSPNRDNNLRVASKKVSGTVVQPGEQFSLNKTLGQRTAGNGYKPAGVISEGQMKEDFGGGVSQVSTTLFNAAFFAGFELDEHKAHSRYISRYPEGRETTLDWSSIDLKFTNKSKTPVVLDMYLADGKVNARVFGVKTLEVDSDSSGRYNYTSPGSITETTPSCTPQSPRQGWSIKITRTMKEIASGKTTKDSFVTVYNPVNQVQCKKPGDD